MSTITVKKEASLHKRPLFKWNFFGHSVGFPISPNWIEMKLIIKIDNRHLLSSFLILIIIFLHLHYILRLPWLMYRIMFWVYSNLKHIYHYITYMLDALTWLSLIFCFLPDDAIFTWSPCRTRKWYSLWLMLDLLLI